MGDNRSTILSESHEIISKLHLLAVFFEDESVYKIYLRSQVIHKLFEQNPELDINKLDLFHLQYTETLIELLKKIKKGNERNVSLIYDEIQINKDLIEEIDDTVFTEENFNHDKHQQSLKINLSLRKLYQSLSDNSSDYPFSRNIHSFSSRFSQDFYYDIAPELLEELVAYNQTEVYSNSYATIHKKLMGLLCKYDFKTEFFCGLKSGSQIIETFKFVNKDRYFLYYPSQNLLLFFDPSRIKNIDLSTTISRNEKLIRDLSDKNDKLESSADLLKSLLPHHIKALLEENYKKISAIDFLDTISRYDVQSNILKTMLNTGQI